MSVTYDLLFKSGLKLPRHGGCFGACAEGHAGGFNWWHSRGPAVADEVYDRINEGQEDHVSLRFYPETKHTYVQQGIWEKLEELVKSLPWMNEVVVLRPLRVYNLPEGYAGVGVVDILTGRRPADQCMIALMTVRSLLQDRDGEVFLKAIEQGLTPVQAWVMAGSFVSGSNVRGKYFVRKGVGEYNLFCTYSFGWNSIREMLRPDYRPWRLDSWQELCGYRREYWIEDVYQPKASISGINRNATLMNVMSEENDTKLFDYDGFTHTGMLDNLERTISVDEFIEKCQELVRKWPQ